MNTLHCGIKQTKVTSDGKNIEKLRKYIHKILDDKKSKKIRYKYPPLVTETASVSVRDPEFEKSSF